VSLRDRVGHAERRAPKVRDNSVERMQARAKFAIEFIDPDHRAAVRRCSMHLRAIGSPEVWTQIARAAYEEPYSDERLFKRVAAFVRAAVDDDARHDVNCAFCANARRR
jgi:hypothetical protein